MEIINELLARIGITMEGALVQGAIAIALATLVAARLIRVLETEQYEPYAAGRGMR